MKITIETIPHDQQRYPTAGDWLIDAAGNIAIRVSETGNWRYDAAIGIHEAVEALLCRDAGISQADVDAFDVGFEDNRQEFGKPSHEPGDDSAAPYAREHCLATAVERLLIAAMELSWSDYADAVKAL